ncbi:MAG: type II toxin-antitoxin system prevent-host-death family antitoxin [Ilumatobacter sp.]|nr:type II toxin-antitoxin system prevent-host-death family antitoxin [Ilumatobacter sp.]
MAVGIRELKANLSEYVSRAAGGEEIVVTDRNRPVIRLVAYTAPSEVDRGIDEGWIEAPRRTRLDDVARARSERSTLDVLQDDRG